MKVSVLTTPGNGRSVHVAKAFRDGFQRHGYSVEMGPYITGSPDLVAAYGWRHVQAFKDCKAKGGHFLYADMGYWDRKPKHRVRDGHHKIVLDDWCPVGTMARGCPSDRFDRLKVQVVDGGKRGDAILVAGMSAKSAQHHGYAPEEWERSTIAAIRKVTERRVIYRPKPSWEGARPIPGAEFSTQKIEIGELLKQCHAVVTHHSNVAIDATVSNIPAYCVTGAGKLVSMKSLAEIETAEPAPLDERKALLADIAYLQWMPEEIRSGKAWDHYRSCL